MKNILIIGGGFAGVWTAAAAVRVARAHGVPQQQLQVTMVTSGDDLVVRPRLHEADPQVKRVALDRVLGPIGVGRIAATVTDIDTRTRTVDAVVRSGRNTVLGYDRLVLAVGSQLVRPAIPGSEWIFDVDTLDAATALDHHLRRLPQRPATAGRFTAVVIGAGFTGLEMATELVARLREVADDADDVRVVLVEPADVVGSEPGEGLRPSVSSALGHLGVETRLGRTVELVTESEVELSGGELIPSSTVIWAAGMAATTLTECIPGERDRSGRLRVDEFLRVPGAPDVFATGDTAAAVAESGHTVMRSCRHAVLMGKFTGHNVAADVLGLDLTPFAPDPYVTCLDLRAARAPVATGRDRIVQKTGEQGKALKRRINAEWLYPPVDDADALLKLADYQGSWSREESCA
ncbi:NAD(P)/FAD-dependent oxidoreductase [Streptomyces chromofuscus]|uniref:NAD(P)/FAD-dependent oxidoreductase n=1 Tax=Streptomyces chromofuscus TaxID=42881 RepID=UPI00167A9DC7|nr:FAD-dependent oxidoreductase [Streptomyces chromofuscus]GGT02594.1 pyridine nucleotide-disulfide oxidoreductase [Streptomyces chromofuscus]